MLWKPSSKSHYLMNVWFFAHVMIYSWKCSSLLAFLVMILGLRLLPPAAPLSPGDLESAGPLHLATRGQSVEGCVYCKYCQHGPELEEKYITSTLTSLATHSLKGKLGNAL